MKTVIAQGSLFIMTCFATTATICSNWIQCFL